jgi:hypothetical protein
MTVPEASALIKLRTHLIETIVYASDEIKKIDNILNEIQGNRGQEQEQYERKIS